MEPTPATTNHEWPYWVAAINTVWLLALSVLTWLRKPGDDAKLQSEQNQKDLAVLRERIEHLTTSEELTELEGTVKGIDERTKGLAEAIQTIRASQARIENYLLSNKS